MPLRTPIRACVLLLGAGMPTWCVAQYTPPSQLPANLPPAYGSAGRPSPGSQEHTRPAAMPMPATPATSAPARTTDLPPAASVPVASVPTTPAADAPVVTRTSAHRAKVLYADGRLTINAENSSLNQILHEISVQSGIRISGGVVDERVFGSYGPDTPARILATLLDGTGSNMLFLASEGSFPGELVLSPRTGGPTPPNPNAAALREPDQETIDRPPDASRPDPGVQIAAPAAQPAVAGQPAAAPASTDPSATPAAPAADSTTEQSPNGVKTPQQIYDQLIQLQKQQQPTTTPP